MTDFRIIKGVKAERSIAVFAIGGETGSLYLVRRMPNRMTRGNGVAIIGKDGIRTGGDYDLRLDEVLAPGTVIEIIT